MIISKINPIVYAGLRRPFQKEILTRSHIDREELHIIADVCCEYYDVSPSEFRGRTKTAELSDARKIFLTLCRKELYTFTCARLGMYIGRDHSTVTIAVQRAMDWLECDPKFRATYNNIRNEAKERLSINGYRYVGSETLTNYGTRDKRLPSLESTNCREGSSHAQKATGELNC